MDILRTPDSRFQDLPGYAYTPKYHRIGRRESSETEPALRMHYVDEGPATARPILMLHGEPSWSYLYRHMIPIFAEAGYRAVAPDLIGFGRSDKPSLTSDYSYQRHEDWLEDFVSGLGLGRIVLVCQDWGGLLGLRMVARHPERFSAVVAANTFLPTGQEPASEAFLAWRRLSQEMPVFDVGKIVEGGCSGSLHQKVRAAYDAPFPDESYKAGARIFPALVPTSADSPGALTNEELWKPLATFDKPFVTAFSDGDPITRGADEYLQDNIAGADKQAHIIIKGAGHFLQEERGQELAAHVLKVANGVKAKAKG